MVLKQSGIIDAVQFKFTNKRKPETCSFDTNKEQIFELTSMQASAVEGWKVMINGKIIDSVKEKSLSVTDTKKC